MTAPKVGDRVHVEYEGVIRSRVQSGRLFVEVEGRTYSAAAYPEHMTVIAPPVKVGDDATLDVLNSLPNASVVIAKGGLVAQLYEGDHGARVWRTTIRCNNPAVSPSIIAGWPATVLHIGGNQ